MGQFQSNLQTATQIATKMESASDRIQSVTTRSITKATRTTLSVNFKAQEANQQMLDLTKQFSAAFNKRLIIFIRYLMNLREWITNFTILSLM